jgi:hypothetical protein
MERPDLSCKRVARKRHYLKAAKPLPDKREVFPWKPNEMVLGPPTTVRPVTMQGDDEP